MSNLSGLKLNYVNFYTFKTIILICLSQTKMYLVGLCTYSGSLEQDILEGVSTNVQFEFKSKSTYFLIIYIHYSEQNMCYLSCKKSQILWPHVITLNIGYGHSFKTMCILMYYSLPLKRPLTSKCIPLTLRVWLVFSS